MTRRSSSPLEYSSSEERSIEAVALSPTVEAGRPYSSEDEQTLLSDELKGSPHPPLSRMGDVHDEFEDIDEDRERDRLGVVSVMTDNGEEVQGVVDLLEFSLNVSAGRRRDLIGGRAQP